MGRFVAKWKRSIAKRLSRASANKLEEALMPVTVPVADGNKAIVGDVPFDLQSASLAELFEGGDQIETTMFPRLIRNHEWAMPEHELLTLGALAKQLKPKLVVEFGTFMGGSTLAMASNLPEESRIVTVDLEPDKRPEHEHGMGIGLLEFEVGCLFHGTRYESKIEQRFANTVEFSDEDLVGKADLVFVDADHTYEFAKRDTETALRLVKPGGAILWHDYSWAPENPECVGVTKTVNEFRDQYGGCRQISGTRFAIYHPALVARRRVA
ncbi:MAG: hypothetical protein Aurels2KO_21170 [Aureliella sp.]